MSFRAFHAAVKTVQRAQIRGLTSTEQTAKEAYLAKETAQRAHAQETTDLWRKISYYVCLPAIAVCTAWVYNFEVEHAAHTEHLKAENGGVLPEVPAYEYLNRRTKPYPWGSNTLFFNPHVNKNMDE